MSSKKTLDASPATSLATVHASVALRAKFDVKKIDACELSVKKYQLASSMQILLTHKSARRQPHLFSSKEPKNIKERSSRLNF
jgi:hypothetical protein